METFDTNLYVEEVNTAEQLLFGKGHRLYINFPDLPDPLRKGDSQDDLNTAMLLIGPLMKATIKNSIENNTIVNAVFNENNTPGIFMMLVCSSYICIAPEGFSLNHNLSYAIAIGVTLIGIVWFFSKKKHHAKLQKTDFSD